jgi:sulfur-carrier protein
MIRLVLPQHLHNLAHISREIEIQVEGPATIGAVLDAFRRALPDAARHHP